MPLIGALVGHSFVPGLGDHFTRGGRIPISRADVTRHLSIAHWVDNFHLLGSRGACVLPAYNLPVELRVDFAILDIGGNDLSSGRSPLTVADAVVTVAHNILNTTCARHVTICSALFRTKNTGHYSPLEYNGQMGQYNNILRHFCDTEVNITYHTHRGFWQGDAWSRDGTHPNTPHGRKLYIKSLRRAVNHSVKCVAK